MHTLVVLALPYLQFYVMPLCLSGPVLSPHVLPRRPRTLTLAPQAEGNTSRVCGLCARAWRPTRHGAAHASRAGRAPARQRARPPATQSCCPPWSPRPPPARRELLGQRPSHLHLTVGRALAWVSAPCLRVPWSRTAQPQQHGAEHVAAGVAPTGQGPSWAGAPSWAAAGARGRRARVPARPSPLAG